MANSSYSFYLRKIAHLHSSPALDGARGGREKQRRPKPSGRAKPGVGMRVMSSETEELRGKSFLTHPVGSAPCLPPYEYTEERQVLSASVGAAFVVQLGSAIR